MNREIERKDSISNSVTIPRDFFSPTQNRPLNRESEYKSIMNESSLNSNGNYSPFVVKKSSNLLNSNSSASSRKIFTEGPNYKNYTPSPNVLKERLSDRFIPVNKGLNLLEKFELTKKWSSKELDFECNIENDNTRNNETSSKSSYTNLLENNFFNSDSMNYIGKQKPKYSLQDSSAVKSKLFSFREEPKRKSCGIPTGPSTILENSEGSRKINTKPYKVIEAPGLIDDFYLNLVDWSSKNDIAAGLSNSVYLWCANKTQCVKLLDYEGDKYVSSVIWSPSGNEVAIGNSEGSVEIWDSKL
jgi:WD40 repeat protein